MIAEFRVKNYYSVKAEQCLSFEATSDNHMENEYCINIKEGVRLLKIGIIYGANASGKTNILMALSFFKNLMIDVPKDKNETIDFEPFLLDKTSASEKTELSMTFYLNKERYVLTLIVDKSKIYSETLICYPSTQPAKLYVRTYNEQTDSTDIEFGSKMGLSKKSQLAIAGNTINNCTVIAAFGKTNVEPSRLNVVYDFFAKYTNDILLPENNLSGYIKKNLNNDNDNSLKIFLIAFLKASDFNISDLELKEEDILLTPELERIIQDSPIPEKAKREVVQKGKFTRSEILFKHETDNGVYELNEVFESRGTIRFMGMAVILKKLLKENRLVCIDEVETSLHYELLSYFLMVFLANSNENSQLIMTTHDINLLNEDFIRRDAVWFADKNSSGETSLIRLSSLGLHKNLSPYNAYKQGKLVKLPFLGSIYLNDNKLCEQK